jgi:short-subunit dehydrogenase
MPGLQQGSVVLITGASTGIGKSLAVGLARKHKARLVINARNENDLKETERLINEAGGQAVCLVGDIAQEQLCKDMVDVCLNRFGRVDALVNNAGLAKTGSVAAITPQDWRYVFEVNFFAALNLTYGVLPHFTAQGHGKIVNVASVAGKVAFPGSVCYAASKFAMTGMSEGLAAEFAGKVDVITVCPGWVRTEFFKKNDSVDDPSAIATRRDIRGWLMRNVLSISSEQCANDIIRAMEKGGSHEIVLTAPGKVIERMAAYCPELTSYLATLIPADRHARKSRRSAEEDKTKLSV